MDSGLSLKFGEAKHPCNAKQSCGMPSKIDSQDADSTMFHIMSTVSTADTLAALTDWQSLADNPMTDNLDNGDDWNNKCPLSDGTDDKDEIDEIDVHDNFLASECSLDGGRLCDIEYSDFDTDLLSDPSYSDLNNSLLSELPLEPIATQKCSFPGGSKEIDEVGKVQKRFWSFSTRSSGDERKGTRLFCNRLLKTTKKQQVEEQDPEVRLLAKVSVLTQIAQWADQGQEPLTPDSKDCGHQVTAPMPSHSKSPTLKRGSVYLDVVDEAAEMDALTGPQGRASRRIAQHAHQAWDSFMPGSKFLGCRDSAGSGFDCQVSAPADDLSFDHGSGRQVAAPLSSPFGLLTSNHVPNHLVVRDEAVEMGTFAGPPGRAFWKNSHHSHQAQVQSFENSLMPGSKVSEWQDPLGFSFGRQVTATADDSIISAVGAMGALPTPSHNPTTNNLDNGDIKNKRYLAPDDKDEIDEIDVHDNFLASECSLDGGRLCDIEYSDFDTDLLSDPSYSDLNNSLLSELPLEPIATQKCSFPGGSKETDEVGKVQKRFWSFSTRSSGDEQKGTRLFCNRLLKTTKKQQVEEQDPEVRLLAKVSVLTQIAQWADQGQEPLTPDSKDCGHQVTAPMPSHSKSPTLKRGSVYLDVADEAVEMDALTGPQGRASRRIAQHAHQAWDSFMPGSKFLGCRDSAGSGFDCQVSAPADDLNFDHGFGRQVAEPLSLHSRSLTSNHVPVHHAVFDEAVEISACAGPPGRALRKIAQHAGKTREMSAASQLN